MINPVSSTQHTRCAIYTRKSTEEGLEQAFNSLHAQREACEAYALSVYRADEVVFFQIRLFLAV